jgi:hypothetical protein
VVTVKATDADKGDYGVVRYEITDSRFLINDTTVSICIPALFPPYFPHYGIMETFVIFQKHFQ